MIEFWVHPALILILGGALLPLVPERFRKAYRERFGVEAETYAAHAYDGMNLMLWAINVAGLNRAKIRDLIAYVPHPWPGVTGDIVLSACLDDVGETTLARFENGHWSYQTREAMQVPRGYVPPRDRLNRDSEAAKSAAAKPSAYGPPPKK